MIREQKTDPAAFYKFGYQGQFAEKDKETGWNHFKLREYDFVAGRWTSKDWQRQYWSLAVDVGYSPENGITTVTRRAYMSVGFGIAGPEHIQAGWGTSSRAIPLFKF